MKVSVRKVSLDSDGFSVSGMHFPTDLPVWEVIDENWGVEYLYASSLKAAKDMLRENHPGVTFHLFKMVCTEYQVTRHYGGGEEGGWWYDWWEPVRVVTEGTPATVRAPDDVLDPEGGSIGRFSVNSCDGDTVYMWERYFGQNQSEGHPHYE